MNLFFGFRSSALKKLIHAILIFIACSMPLHAALGPKVQLKSTLAAKQRLISVTVPKGYSNVSVEVFQKESGWKSIASAKAKTGVMKFKLPSYSKNARWRAVGRKWVSDQQIGSRSKFPAKFYKGKKTFDAISGVSLGGGRLMSGNVVAMASSTTADASKSSADVSQLPEEADIWKIDGSTVYFFNQLRGLQVLDLSNPADPRLTASLRMPALGQDLYVIREADGSRWQPQAGFVDARLVVRWWAIDPDFVGQFQWRCPASDS